MHDNRSVGKVGETIACRYLESIGWRILERNYRCRVGEIDIVGRDGQDLVFCEVKTRTTGTFGGSVAAISSGKEDRLRRTAAHYLLSRPVHSRSGCRFDMVGVDFVGSGEPSVTHLVGIL